MRLPAGRWWTMRLTERLGLPQCVKPTLSCLPTFTRNRVPIGSDEILLDLMDHLHRESLLVFSTSVIPKQGKERIKRRCFSYCGDYQVAVDGGTENGGRGAGGMHLC